MATHSSSFVRSRKAGRRPRFDDNTLCVNHVETDTAWYNPYLESSYLLRSLKAETMEIARSWPFPPDPPHCTDKTDHHSITYTSNWRTVPGNWCSPSIICLLLGCILTRSSLIIKANITKASIWLVYAYKSVIFVIVCTHSCCLVGEHAWVMHLTSASKTGWSGQTRITLINTVAHYEKLSLGPQLEHHIKVTVGFGHSSCYNDKIWHPYN